MNDLALAVTVFCLILIPVWLYLRHIAREIDLERKRREMKRHIADTVIRGSSDKGIPHIAQVRINVVEP